MKLYDLLHIDLGALLLGRIEIRPRAARPIQPRVNRRRWHAVRNAVGFVPRLLLETFYPDRRRTQQLVFEQLSRIVACNAPMVPALDAITPDAPFRRVRLALYRLRDALAEGRSLSEAMRRQPRVFPRYSVDLIHAGENSGSLHPAIKDVIRILERSDRLHWAIEMPLVYFAALNILGVAITTFLLAKVFPVFHDLLREFGGATRLDTHPIWVINAVFEAVGYRLFGGLPVRVTSHVVMWWMAVAAVLLGGWLAWRKGLIRLAASQIALRIPILGRWVIKAQLAHVARIMPVLLKAGYPVDEALDSTAATGILGAVRNMLARLRDGVRRGDTLSAACDREAQMLPLSFRTMIALGERGGHLYEAFERIADQYDREVHTAGMIASRFILPVTVLLTACWFLVVYSYQFVILAELADSIVSQI